MRLSISLISKAFAPDSIFGRDGPRFNADAAAAPLRQMLPVCCRTERVTRIDLSTSEIEFDDGSGTLTRLHYDHVVIACGAESNLGIIPGMSDQSFASFELHCDRLEQQLYAHDEPVTEKDVSAVVAAMDRNFHRGLDEIAAGLQ
jgi:NADH dehydrogenase FAD-containing subunit